MDNGIAGLASGFDWKQTVQQLVALEGQQKSVLAVERTGLQNRITAINDLKTKLGDFKTASDNLKLVNAFYPRTATTGIIAANASPVFGSPVALDQTPVGSYVFNVSQMATATVRAGAVGVGLKLNGTADVSGVTVSAMNISATVSAGTFTVNGSQVTIATTDSLQSVFTAISTATGGVVTASYDPVADKISLASSSAISLGTPADTSNFLGAVKLFANGTNAVSSLTTLGVVNLNNSITNSNLATTVTDGGFSINGVAFTYTAAGDSLQGIMAQINTSTAGVNIAYDSITNKFTLTNKQTGTYDLTVSDTGGGNLMEAMGLNSTSTLTSGVNAQYTVNSGPTLTSQSNVLDSTSHGVSGLSVTALKLGSDTITVSQDATKVQVKIDDFISKYNAVQTFLDEKTKTTVVQSYMDERTKKMVNKPKVVQAILGDNKEVAALRSGLRKMIFTSVNGLSGSVKRIPDLGIDFETDSYQLKVKDSKVLTNALTANTDAVAKLFTDTTGTPFLTTVFDAESNKWVPGAGSGTDATQGRSVVFAAFVNSFVGDPLNINIKGTFETQKTSYDTQIKNINKKITDLESYLASRERQLTESFIAMENARQKSDQQMSQLMKAFQK